MFTVSFFLCFSTTMSQPLKREAGIIVFDVDRKDKVRTILVQGRKNFNTGFPKGWCRPTESLMECAFRELKQTTGLSHEHVDIIEYVDYKEQVNAHVEVTYFVALTKPNLSQQKALVFKPQELEIANWYDVDAAIEKHLSSGRFEILQRAHTVICETTSDTKEQTTKDAGEQKETMVYHS